MNGKDLKESVKQSGIKIADLVKKTKIPEQTIYSLYRKVNVEQHYLDKMEGAGVKLQKTIPSISNARAQDIESPANCYIVPIKAFGGFLNGYENKSYMNTLEKTSFPLVRGECFLFEVDGFSMVVDEAKEDSFMPGSWVVTTRLSGFNDLMKNRCYVFQTIDGIIIKQFEKIDGEYCHLRCLNPEYEMKPIHLKDIKVLYFIELKINKV